MTPLLHAELRTTRIFVALVGVTAFTSLLIVVLVCLLTEPTEESVLRDVCTADTTSLFILVLAIVGITGEWRHRTIAGALLAAPDRVRFLAAKTLAFAAAGLLLSLVISISVGILGMAILSGRDLPTPELGDLLVQILRNAELAGLLGAFGLALGSLIRNQPTAIVAVLVLAFLIEPTVIALAPDVGRFGPFSGLSAGIQSIPADDIGADGADLLSPGLASLAMLVWIAVPFVAGVVMLRRRDLN